MSTRLRQKPVNAQAPPIVRKRWVALIAALALAIAGSVTGVSLALYSDTATIPNSTFTSDTLNAPTSLSASGGVTVTLNWTATSDTYASGHRVFRATSSGGPYSQIAQLSPRTTMTYSDAPGGGTFYYVIRAYYQNWESASSNEVSCTRILVLYAC